MYISGGSNVYPREIEEKILAYGPIWEVCVLGVPDPIWGEIGVMVGVLKDGAQWGPAEFQSWPDQNVARYKPPRKVFTWHIGRASLRHRVCQSVSISGADFSLKTQPDKNR